ncbi:hypothetical protein CTI12_AA194230 [Artemisia annua]|uniref:Uncharacterized protein n=1 Tax=Artemisia annua TaxID=35608 RepID=A0A2U1P4K6_ARTAN|nr:hypothetical protein CTI12_AA194230 [Artemisia annua]
MDFDDESKVKDLELKGHTDSADQLCWDPKHSDLIATASNDKIVRLWDICSGKCSQQPELSRNNSDITYKPDGTHVCSNQSQSCKHLMLVVDDELRILDVRKFKPIHKRKFNYEASQTDVVYKLEKGPLELRFSKRGTSRVSRGLVSSSCVSYVSEIHVNPSLCFFEEISALGLAWCQRGESEPFDQLRGCGLMRWTWRRGGNGM